MRATIFVSADDPCARIQQIVTLTESCRQSLLGGIERRQVLFELAVHEITAVAAASARHQDLPGRKSRRPVARPLPT